MQLILLGQGPHHDFAINGTAVVLGDVHIDCAAEQRDETVAIDIYHTEQGMSRQGPGAFAATVEIPPRQYPAEESIPETQPELDAGSAQPVEPLPLNPDTITVTLWPK